jgi:hypothetical protein
MNEAIATMFSRSQLPQMMSHVSGKFTVMTRRRLTKFLSSPCTPNESVPSAPSEKPPSSPHLPLINSVSPQTTTVSIRKTKTIGALGFDSRRGAGNFSLHYHVQNGSGAHPASYPMGIRGSSLGVKWLERKADHSPRSSAVVEEWVVICLHSPNTPLWRGAQLRHRDNFTFTFHDIFFSLIVLMLCFVTDTTTLYTGFCYCSLEIFFALA